MLWGDQGADGATFGVAGIAAVLGGILVKVLDWAVAVWRERRESQEADRKDKRDSESEVLQRLEALLDRTERQLQASERENNRIREYYERENNRIREQAEKATIRAERAVVWIKHLENHLKIHKIPFEAWAEVEERVVVVPHSPESAPDTTVED